MKAYKTITAIIIALAFFASCDKKSFNETDPNDAAMIIQENGINIPADLPSLWYIDNQLVNEPDYATSQANQEILFEIITTGIDSLNGKISMINLAFTTREGYIEYGIKHNLKLKEELEFSEHMRQYAEETGAIDEYERTGTIPDTYLAYQEEYYYKIFGHESSKAMFILLDGRDYNGEYIGVPYFWMLATIGKMKNRVSSIMSLGPGAAITLYDETYFRGYLKTYVFVLAYFAMILPARIDNRTECVVTH